MAGGFEEWNGVTWVGASGNCEHTGGGAGGETWAHRETPRGAQREAVVSTHHVQERVARVLRMAVAIHGRGKGTARALIAGGRCSHAAPRLTPALADRKMVLAKVPSAHVSFGAGVHVSACLVIPSHKVRQQLRDDADDDVGGTGALHRPRRP